jgi:ABC-type uncharacterized transport system involved in gliding motility auxiliary subunit
MMTPRHVHQSFLERLRGPFVLASLICLLLAAAFALVAAEFSASSKLALAAAVLFFGMYVAIDPGKAFSVLKSRESIYGSNALVLTIAVVGILVVFNVLAARFHHRWDLTAQRDFSLSDQTLALLGRLPEPVHAVGYFSSSMTDQRKAEDLLKEYAARSNGKFTYEMVDTNVDPVKPLAEGIRLDGTIRYKMGDRKQESITTDEAHMTTALIKLANPDPLKVYYVIGHGERDLDNFGDEGVSEVKTQIQADNFVVEPLSILAQGRIPEDARAIIINSPKVAFDPVEMDAINRYLDGKGRMVLLVEPFQEQASAEELIKRWDLTFGKGIAVDPVSSSRTSPFMLLVDQRYGMHSIVKDLNGVRSVIPFSTTVEIPEFIKRGVDISALTMTVDQRSWLETDRETLEFTEGVDKKGPLVLAVAVEQLENPPAEDPMPGFRDPNARVKNRAVIFGSAEFAINGLIKQPIGNRDLLLNSLNWVTETDQLIQNRPYIAERRSIFLSGPQQNFVLFFSALFYPIILLGIGSIIWWMRR